MKFVIALWIMLLSILSVQAQVKFAVSAGYNHNTARIHKNDVLQSTGDVPGGYANLRLETEFEAPLHFTGLVGYNMRGYVYNVLPDSTVSTRMHYVDIAPMLNYHFNTGTNSFLNVFAGPMVGFALAGTQTVESAGQKTSAPMKFSLTNHFSLANIGIQSGLAFHFNNWFLEAGYHLGVSSINNEEEVDRTNIKNRAITVGIGYWLR